MDSYKVKMVKWKKRRQKIVKYRDSGMSFAEIGRMLDISRQRAQQLYLYEVKK